MLKSAEVRATGKKKSKIRIVIPEIIDRGTANGARDLKATLVHSGKYIVAQAQVSGNGATFEFPAGKLIHPESHKPVERVNITVEPINGAQLAYKHAGQISLPLKDKHPRIRKELSDDLISFYVDKAFYVHMAYPVTVKIDGGGSKISRIQARITPGKSPRHHSGTLTARSVSKGIGVFAFEAMPTGKCTFTYSTRRATKMITAKEMITLAAPVEAKFTGKVPIPQKPDLAAVNTQRIRALQQQKNFETFEADLNNAIGSFTSKIAALKEDYLERFNVAFEALREQDKLRRQQKGLDSKQRQALQDQLGENRKALQAAKKVALQEFTEIRKRYSDADKKVTQEIRDSDRKIQAEYSRARDEMYAGYKKVSELKKQIEKAVREVSSELHHNGSVYKTAAEAESFITKLEQDVAAIDGLVQQIQASVEATNNARQRLKAQLDAQEKRRFAREQPTAKTPSILADVEQMRLLLEALKKNAVAEKAKQAAKNVKKRHELRKKNAAEFARLLKEVKTLSGTLPDADVAKFDETYRQISAGFNEILDDPEETAKTVAKLYAQTKKFLDQNEAVVGDIRRGDKEKEPAYARIESLFRQINDMVNSGMVYAGTDYFKAWEPAKAKLMAAAQIRAGVGKRMIALEKNLIQAKDDLDGYRTSVASAATEIETLMAQVTEMSADKGADMAMMLNILEKAWQKTEQMPVYRRDDYQEKISAAAEDLAADGRLVRYAKAARRPLVMFESYLEGGDVNKEVKVGKPLFRCKASQDSYTHVSLKARIVGLPPGKAAVVAVEDDWYRYSCHRDKKTGLYFVSATVMGDQATKIRLLGTGADNPPIEYPFLRQVAVQ